MKFILAVLSNCSCDTFMNRRHILLKEFNIKRSRNECPVIVTVPSTWTKVQYEQIARIFFEIFNSPGLYIANQALMALYGCGSLNGLVVDIGYGKSGTLVSYSLWSVIKFF